MGDMSLLNEFRSSVSMMFDVEGCFILELFLEATVLNNLDQHFIYKGNNNYLDHIRPIRNK